MSIRRKGKILGLASALLSACAGAPSFGNKVPWISPMQAVMLAAAAPRTGVTGVFAMTVRATGEAHGVFLNSQRDYRDQRDLSIAVSSRAMRALKARLWLVSAGDLVGRRILVSGTARRVRIAFVVDGVNTGKYYYQTHVRVTEASQIRVL